MTFLRAPELHDLLRLIAYESLGYGELSVNGEGAVKSSRSYRDSVAVTLKMMVKWKGFNESLNRQSMPTSFISRFL